MRLDQCAVIEDLCRERGITVKELFEKIGRSVSSFTRAKQQKRSLSVETVVEIADFFKVSADRLLGTGGERVKPAGANSVIVVSSSCAMRTSGQRGVFVVEALPEMQLTEDQIKEMVKRQVFGRSGVSDEMLEMVKEEARKIYDRYKR